MGGLIENIFPGIAGMENIHPMLVHFPIALLNSFLILEVLSLILKSESLKTGATWMLYTGTIGAVLAVIAGFRAAATIEHSDEVHAIMETHEHLALAVLFLAVVLSLWRIVLKKRLAGTWWLAYLALSVIMVVILSFGADYGGLMVYTHGVGVKAVEKPETKAHDYNAHSHGDNTNEAITNTPHGSNPHKH